MPDPGAAEAAALGSWRRQHAWRGTTPWAQCAGTSWLVTWVPSDGGDECAAVLLLGRRPTALRMARSAPGAALLGAPRSGASVERMWQQQRSWRADARPGELVLLWREWRWWARHADVHRIGRGDLSLTTPPAPGAAPGAVLHLDLRDPVAYSTLIETASRGPLWVRRFRWRRRRRTVRTSAPDRLPRLLVMACYSRRVRGDLTWAPRPPAPPAGATSAPPTVEHHYHGSWFLRGCRGPRPPGYLPMPPDLLP
jgi:hypothetical protein